MEFKFLLPAKVVMGPDLRERTGEYRVIGFTCCFRQSAGLKHIGISFGFECCYNERSPIAGDQSWNRRN
ncbi:hypothetical protein ACR40Y_00015 [Pseudomonas aeruginosa]|uniref:hypothetical protein n=1 Tax=Pseudomonas aeruginosa TaxID=287 RepID=UPI003F511E86